MHNIHFAQDFDGNIADIFEGRLPQDPSIYLYVASRLDPTLAPEGKEALYVLVPVPSLAHGYSDWSEEAVNRYKEIVFRKIEGIEGLEDLRADIVSETIYTPRDFEERFSAYKGATFGLAPTLMQSNYFRPHNKADFCEKLYFAGSSVHPGAGVPIVLTSAKLAAAEIIKDLGKTDA
jgi:phytoene desaturase